MDARLSFASALLVLAAACGDDGGGSEDPTPDAGPPPLDLRPYTIDTRGSDGGPSSTIVAYQDGDRWLGAAPTATPGVFTFVPARREVAYAIVCRPREARRPVRVQVNHLMLGVERAFTHLCLDVDTFDPIRAPVAVTVTPANATVTIGFRTSEGTAAARTLEVEPGFHDVLVEAGNRVLVQRDVQIPSPAPLAFDVEANGVDLVPLPVTLPAVASGETLSAEVAFRTGTGTFALVGGRVPEAAWLHRLPDSALAPGDGHHVTVRTQRGSSRRWLSVPVGDGGAVPPLVLPPDFTDVTGVWFETPSIVWKGRFPDEQPMSLYLSLSGAERSYGYDVRFDGAWISQTGRAVDGSWTVPDLSAVPGWDPSWRVDRTWIDRATWSLEVSSDTLGASRGVVWRGDVADR